jgi:hypothetical protein
MIAIAFIILLSFASGALAVLSAIHAAERIWDWRPPAAVSMILFVGALLLLFSAT